MRRAARTAPVAQRAARSAALACSPPPALTAGAYKKVTQGCPARMNALPEQSGMGPTGWAAAVSTRL